MCDYPQFTGHDFAVSELQHIWNGITTDIEIVFCSIAMGNIKWATKDQQ